MILPLLPKFWAVFLVIAFSSILAAANRVIVSDKNPVVCSGIYSKKDWGGRNIPHVGIQLNKYDNEKYDKKKNPEGVTDSSVEISYVIFEYKDLPAIGSESKSGGDIQYICNQQAVNLDLCDELEKGRFIVDTKNWKANSTIFNSQLTHFGPAHINYTVTNTGYYCVSTHSSSTKHYEAAINFQNAYGELSGSEIPKLLSYGILTLCYAIVLALYGFQFFKKRNQHQILPLQKYLLGILSFLTFDTLVVWSYYDLVNRTRRLLNFVTVYMVFISILNSFKIAFSFYLILLISLGFGVLLLKLNKGVMLKCKILAAFHFVASMIYLINSYFGNGSKGTQDGAFDNMNTSILYFLLFIPITIVLTIYYIVILVSIKKTTAQLHAQRQVVKLRLYERLFKVIFFAVVLTMAGLFFSSFSYMSLGSTGLVEQYWKSAYFVFDFWPSVVFFIVFVGISWLWRPTETSYMLAVSQQLSQDENNENGYTQGTEFELDDMSLMSHSDTEGPRRDNDSFELGEDAVHPSGSTDNDSAPPGYEEDVKGKDKKEQEEPDSNLFGFGNDSDEETPEEDDRFKSK